MTNEEIKYALSLKWQTSTPQEIAADVDEIVEGLIDEIAVTEHNNIGIELSNIGVLINHDVNEITSSRGICKRKKAPTPIT